MLEDAWPPRFANQIGAALLTAATAFLLLGVPTAGWILAGVVGGLALLAATTGFCLGCWMHRRIYGTCDVCDLSFSGNTTSAASMSSRSPL